MIEAQRENLSINKLIAEKKEIIFAEGDMIVPDSKPDILNTISTSGVVSIYKKEVQSEKVRLDGTVNAYIMYMPDGADDTVRGLNTSVDFSENLNIPNCQEGMEAISNIKIKSIEAKVINGRKIGIKATLEVNLKIYSNEEVEIINEVQNEEDVQILKEDLKLNSLVGTGTTKIYAKDNIQIDSMDNLAEILQAQVCLVDKDIKISYNKVLTKAEAEIKIMYLTEDNRINTATTKIPIMGFVDMQNVNENCECEVQNNLNNLIVKPNSNEEHSIAIEADIDITCLAYETKQINMIEDLYSTTKDITFTKREVNAVIERNRITDMYTAKENIRIPEVTGRVLDVQIAPTINNMQVRNGKVIYEGNLRLNIMFEQSNGINTRGVDLPYNFDVISDKIEEKSMVETTLKIKQNDFIIRDGTIEVTIGVEFNLSEQKSRKINMIENVEMEESKECNTYSMVIYFVKQGDTLWSIAKRFKSTVEDIAKINDIENPNKISVGQRLYIPRYCNRRVAV